MSTWNPLTPSFFLHFWSSFGFTAKLWHFPHITFPPNMHSLSYYQHFSTTRVVHLLQLIPAYLGLSWKSGGLTKSFHFEVKFQTLSHITQPLNYYYFLCLAYQEWFFTEPPGILPFSSMNLAKDQIQIFI